MIAWWIILSTAMTLVLSCVWYWHKRIKQSNSVKLFINNTRWVSDFNVQGSPRRYPCLTVVVPNYWARQSWQTKRHSNRWAIFSMLVEVCCCRKMINDMAVDIAWREDYPVSENLQLTLSKTLPSHYLHTSSKIFWKPLLQKKWSIKRSSLTFDLCLNYSWNYYQRYRRYMLFLINYKTKCIKPTKPSHISVIYFWQNDQNLVCVI